MIQYVQTHWDLQILGELEALVLQWRSLYQEPAELKSWGLKLPLSIPHILYWVNPSLQEHLWLLILNPSCMLVANAPCHHMPCIDLVHQACAYLMVITLLVLQWSTTKFQRVTPNPPDHEPHPAGHCNGGWTAQELSFRDTGCFLPRQPWHWGLSMWAEGEQSKDTAMALQDPHQTHGEIPRWVRVARDLSGKGWSQIMPWQSRKGTHAGGFDCNVRVWSSLKYQAELLLLSSFLWMCLRCAVGDGQVCFKNGLRVTFILSADLSRIKEGQWVAPALDPWLPILPYLACSLALVWTTPTTFLQDQSSPEGADPKSGSISWLQGPGSVLYPLLVSNAENPSVLLQVPILLFI